MQKKERKKIKTPFHLNRYREILTILVKYGFSDILSTLAIEKYVSFVRRAIRMGKKPIVSRRLSRWERIRKAAEELGPAFIKLGQFLSNRPDILPPELITELEKLQDAVTPITTELVKAIVEKELAVPLSSVFLDFSDQPIASASVAQVHKATLKSGEDVAVKVQRPNIEQVILEDIAILRNLAMLIERHYERAKLLRLRQVVDEFERVILKELDFSIEASHIETFRRNFKNDNTVYVPLLYNQYTTKRLIVTEFIHGIKINDIEAIRKAGIDTVELSKKGSRLILKQIFDHGFFHADPHPGNILVKNDGTICFLDFGAIGILTPSLRRCMSTILFGVITKDANRIVKVLSLLSGQPLKNPQNLEYDIAEVIEEYSLAVLKDINVGIILRRLSLIIVQHELRIIPGFYLLMKTLVAFEGIGYRLNPQFNMIETITPFIKKHILESPQLRYLPYELYFTIYELVSLLKDLPFELKELSRIIRCGELQILFEHRGLLPFMLKLDQLVNRVVFGLLLAALIIGSSIVIHSATPPFIFDIPLIGFFGFLLAAIISFGILFSIIRKNKL